MLVRAKLGEVGLILADSYGGGLEGSSDAGGAFHATMTQPCQGTSIRRAPT
jgi:hypothetical protein